MDDLLTADVTELHNHDEQNNTVRQDTTEIPDDTNDDRTVPCIQHMDTTPTVTAFERQQKSTSNAFPSLLLPCVESPVITTSRRQQQRQARGAYGVSISSELEIATTPSIIPVPNDFIAPKPFCDSLWNNNDETTSAKDDDSDASFLSHDGEEDIELTTGEISKTCLSASNLQ